MKSVAELKRIARDAEPSGPPEPERIEPMIARVVAAIRGIQMPKAHDYAEQLNRLVSAIEANTKAQGKMVTVQAPAVHVTSRRCVQ